MSTQMATTRQPFAPLNSSRLQNLTSLKNRQNALPTALSPSSKRKAASFDSDNDAENIDPIIFLSPKRSKCPDGSSKDTSFSKPNNFFLTRAPPSPNDFSSLKPVATSPRRPVLQARSPVKLDTRSAPLSAPAGRSPTRKRIGLLNRRRTSAPFTRVDPPKFGVAGPSGLGFSIDAALSGTIPSYTPRPAVSKPISATSLKEIPILHQAEARDGWFFDIHEDTEEELATNLMEHGACTLDISSDEESAARERDARGKENVPPMDDVSQTRTVLSSSSSGMMTSELEMSEIKARVRASRRKREEGAIEIDRCPLGDLVAEDFYAEGVDASEVFLVADDEHSHDEPQEPEQAPEPKVDFDFTSPTEEVISKEKEIDIETLMQKDRFDIGPKAALLEPIQKAEPGFEVWESGSANGDE